MSFNDYSEALHDCIYGGPIPEDALQACLAQAGLGFPVQTTVVPDTNTAARLDCWDFRPGDGLIYRTAARKGALGKDWREARDAVEWQRSLQLRILELRRRALATAQPVNAEDEARLRQLALHHCQALLPDWREAVDYWADAVIQRTQKKIHDAHRACLAFLLEAAEPLPTIGFAGSRYHHAMQQLLASFTAEGIRHWLLQGLEIVGEQLAGDRGRLDTSMRRALCYIEQRLAEPLSLDAVAVAVGMSPAAFSRKFKASLGQTFTSYVQALRLEQAIPMLLHSDRSVLDVALDAGFGSVEQFHRVFKAQLGLTPLAYRKGRMGK